MDVVGKVLQVVVGLAAFGLVMALLLGALVLLTFAISIAKIQMGMGASH